MAPRGSSWRLCLNVQSNVSCYEGGREVLVKVLVEVAMHSALDFGPEWDACFSLSILSPWPEIPHATKKLRGSYEVSYCKRGSLSGEEVPRYVSPLIQWAALSLVPLELPWRVRDGGGRALKKKA